MIKKTIIITLTFITLLGCVTTKQQRTENRVANKINKLKIKHPEAFTNTNTVTVRVDTVLQPFTIEGETKYDTVTVTKYLDKFLSPTVNRELFIEDFLNVARDTIIIDSLGVHLMLAGVGVIFSLRKDANHIELEQKVETVTITKTEVIKKVPFWVYIVIVICTIITLLTLLKR